MKLYLAGPYTHQDQSVMDDRASAHSEAFALLMRQGYTVYSPICQTHMTGKENNLPVTWEFWQNFDAEFIKWCDELVVLKIDGWDQSTGTRAEIAIAKLLGKSVTTTTLDELRLMEQVQCGNVMNAARSFGQNQPNVLCAVALT